MKNKTKKISLIVIILLILTISSIKIIKQKNTNINLNEQEKNMETKEMLMGSGLYKFNKNYSQIEWEGKKTFIKEWIDSGNISIKSGDVKLTDGKIIEGKIIIDMNSILTQKTGGGGEDTLSKHLKSTDFFDVNKFPTSQFILNSISPSENKNEYIAKGDITIKNITKDIEFPIIIYMENGLLFMNGEIIIDRTQFDVRFGSNNFFKDIGDKAIDNNFMLKLKLILDKNQD